MPSSTFVTPAAVAPPGQPDIAYAPDFGKWQARTKRRLKEEQNLPKTVPAGFPTELKGDLVWDGETLAETYDWTYTLSPEQLAEVDRAVAHFKCEPTSFSRYRKESRISYTMPYHCSRMPS